MAIAHDVVRLHYRSVRSLGTDGALSHETSEPWPFRCWSRHSYINFTYSLLFPPSPSISRPIFFTLRQEVWCLFAHRDHI